MGIFESMMVMSVMSFAIFVNGLVISAIPLAAGFFAMVFFMIGAVNPGVMYLAILVSCFVVCTILSAAGFLAMVLVVVGAVDACMAVSVMDALMVAMGISGAAGGSNQQSDGEQ